MKDEEIRQVKRFNYPGERQFMITSPIDGLLEPIDCGEIMRMMRTLTKKLDYRNLDCIVGLDSAGIIPAFSASMITGLPLIVAYKADLEVENKIKFLEPHSANPAIFIYNLPKGSNVLLCDDEIRTGQTVMNCIDSIVEAGSFVRGIIVPVESTKFGVRKKLKDKGYELQSCMVHEF